MHRIYFAVALAIATASCLPPPKKAYSAEEIGGIDSLEELMRVNASKADPLFGIRDQTSFTDDEFARMVDAGAKIEASGTRSAGFAGTGDYDDGFADFSNKLSAQGKALADAGTAKDAAAASKALNDMRGTCKGCHGVYR